MFNYHQWLREGTLKSVEGKPVQEKADALNLIEAIISGDMDVDELVDAIANGTVPVTYVPNA